MKLLLILLLPLLTGCVHLDKVPPGPIPVFPPVSKELLETKCPELQAAIPSELLSDMLKTVIANYGEYHKCKAMVDAWQTWYAEQKTNYEKIKK